MGACCSRGSIAVEPEAAIHSVDAWGGGRAPAAGTAAAEPSGNALSSSPPLPTPSSVKVAVVVRPLLPFEQQKGGSRSVAVCPPDKVVLPPLTQKTVAGGADGGAEFVFDRVFDALNAGAGQQLYQEMVQPVVERFLQGFNGCVLAYGQTGSGKTHQMGGPASLQPQDPNSSRSSSNSAAIVPQACAQLLKYAAGARAVYDVQVKVSFVEIYGEVVQDLLAPAAPPLAQSGSSTGNLVASRAVYGSSSYSSSNGSASGGSSPRRVTVSSASDYAGPGSPTGRAAAADAGDGSSGGGSAGGSSSSSSSSSSSIAIYENAEGQIVMDGVTEVILKSAADLAALLQKGGAARATASHKLNQQSSRSHAILTLTLQQRAHASTARQLPAELRCLASKLHLVDLAGSERAKETGTSGQRFAEGVSINRGLLELGNVITALTEGASRKHIPYRNSKLTRLLQDSLGGNSETLFLACVSPADSNREHTLGTLRYASRAMSIKNSLQRSVMGPAEELAYLRDLVLQLQEENAQLRQAAAAAASAGPGEQQQQQQQQQLKSQGRPDSVCELFVKAC